MFMEFLSRGRFGLIKRICIGKHLGGVRRTETIVVYHQTRFQISGGR